MDATFVCCTCGTTTSANTAHPQFPHWAKKGLKLMCWLCGKTRRHRVCVIERSGVETASTDLGNQGPNEWSTHR